MKLLKRNLSLILIIFAYSVVISVCGMIKAKYFILGGGFMLIMNIIDKIVKEWGE